MDLWPLTMDARQSLLHTFQQLDDEQWSVPSLSEGWTVRQVLAHLTLSAHPPARRYVAAIVRARGSFDRANHALAVADAERSTDELLARYRSAIDRKFSPPGWPQAAPFSDVVLHTLDVQIPLGIPIDWPADQYAPVLDHLFSLAGKSFARSGRPAVRWVAADHDWSHGDGPEVRGSMRDLALTAAGRGAAVDALAGDGVTQVRDWVS